MFMQEKHPKTNYVICCWSGPRRFLDNRARTNPCHYLQSQFQRLNDLTHNLTKITLAISHNPKEPKAFREYLNSFPKRIQNTEVEIMERPNSGMSYGAISDVYVKHKNEFEYYFQIEDDYLVGQHNFDTIHINFLKEHPRCGLVCAVAGKHPHLNTMPYHAMVSNGCFKTEALEKLAKNNGGILWPCPYNAKPNGSYTSIEETGQINISVKLMELGYDVLDLGEKYKTGFRMINGSIRWFYPQNNKIIYEPI